VPPWCARGISDGEEVLIVSVAPLRPGVRNVAAIVVQSRGGLCMDARQDVWKVIFLNPCSSFRITSAQQERVYVGQGLTAVPSSRLSPKLLSSKHRNDDSQKEVYPILPPVASI